MTRTRSRSGCDRRSIGQMIARLGLVAILALLPALGGCSGLGTLTFGYARPLSERGSRGGLAVHGALGMGGGSRGEGAGLGPHLRIKSNSYSGEVALGAHLYVLSMPVEQTHLGGLFTSTGDWGGYGRLGVNALEFDQYEGDELLGTLGPSLDLGILMPYALTLGTSIEHDIRMAGHPDETFVFFMLGVGFGGVGPF